MKFRVEAECTPTEARSFLGLPDVAPLNEHLVREMMARFDQNAAMLQPDELMKTWMGFGGQAQEQFMRLLTAATQAGLGGAQKGRG